ncbi:peptidase M15 (plasmid) [Fulvitalea axinellae]|uniref:Peptidase M15 n=1 Tax=Fulvitalea axinellae TaxID=1182444 RepID=A0AAU9CR64_9BACT|nr:peptidase M15 [Fulvitalea axinellae]
MKNNISENVSYREAVKSETAIRHAIVNEPTEKALANMRRLAEEVFEPLRKRAGGPVAVTSFFRSPALNRRIGGSPTSQHCFGQAMDVDGHVYGGISNREIFRFILKHCEFDQLIWEFGDDIEPAWVHVSLREKGNRKQALRAVKVAGKTQYWALDKA